MNIITAFKMFELRKILSKEAWDSLEEAFLKLLEHNKPQEAAKLLQDVSETQYDLH